MKNKLSNTQRVDSTAYIFTSFGKLISQKITQGDYDFTHQGNIDKDADAIYIIMKKYHLVDDILKSNLKGLNSFEYFESLTFQDFENEK